MDSEQTDIVYSVPEAAKVARVTTFVIRDWINEGILIRTETGKERRYLWADKIGGRFKIKASSLAAFVKLTSESARSPSALPPTPTPTRTKKRELATRKRLAEALTR